LAFLFEKKMVVKHWAVFLKQPNFLWANALAHDEIKMENEMRKDVEMR